MPASEIPERINTLAQPVVLSTLQKLIRALEVVEGAEEDLAQRAGVIKAKGIARLFANIWGAGFEEETVAGLLARAYEAPEAQPITVEIKKHKRMPKKDILLSGLERLAGVEFTSKDVRRETGLPLDYVTPRCSLLAQTGRLRIVRVQKCGRGSALNVYRVVDGGKNAVL